MEQVVYTFLGKKNTNYFAAIKSDLVFSSIVTANMQKTLQSTNTGAEHTHIISKHYMIRNHVSNSASHPGWATWIES